MNYVDDILHLQLLPSHKYYWNNLASRHHIARMLRLGSVEQLQGDVNGITDSRYLMHLVATIDMPNGARRYEFLIEYDVFNPSQGIYFGCKSVTLPGHRHSKELSLATEDWQLVKPHVLRRLNNTFLDKDFTHRFRQPDNAHDNTFWPFWISLYEDEDPQELAVRALTIIAAAYRQLSDGSLPDCPGKEQPEEKVIIPRTAFTRDAYARLHDSILSAIKASSTPTQQDRAQPTSKPEHAWKLFENFLQKAVERGVLHQIDYYEKAWMLDSRFTDIDFKCMITLLFNRISEQLEIEMPKIPWSGLIGIFLRADGTPFKQQIKTLNPTPATRRHWVTLLSSL